MSRPAKTKLATKAPSLNYCLIGRLWTVGMLPKRAKVRWEDELKKLEGIHVLVNRNKKLWELGRPHDCLEASMLALHQQKNWSFKAEGLWISTANQSCFTTWWAGAPEDTPQTYNRKRKDVIMISCRGPHLSQRQEWGPNSGGGCLGHVPRGKGQAPQGTFPISLAAVPRQLLFLSTSQLSKVCICCIWGSTPLCQFSLLLSHGGFLYVQGERDALDLLFN